MTTHVRWLTLLALTFCTAAVQPQDSKEIQDLKRQVETLQKENAALKLENEQLKRDLKALRTAADAAKKPLSLEDPFKVGMVWTGKGHTGKMQTIKLISLKGDRAVFDAEGFKDGAWFHLSGKVKGKTVMVDDIERYKQPKGDGALSFSKPQGSITISNNGDLSVLCTARMRSGSDGGEQGWEYTVHVAKLE